LGLRACDTQVWLSRKLIPETGSVPGLVRAADLLDGRLKKVVYFVRLESAVPPDPEAIGLE
jgi:hypothetical protein